LVSRRSQSFEWQCTIYCALAMDWPSICIIALQLH